MLTARKWSRHRVKRRRHYVAYRLLKDLIRGRTKRKEMVVAKVKTTTGIRRESADFRRWERSSDSPFAGPTGDQPNPKTKAKKLGKELMARSIGKTGCSFWGMTVSVW